MKNGLSGLLAAALLSCCTVTFAADAGTKQESPAKAAPEAAKPAAQENTKAQPAGPKLEAGAPRPKDRDLRHCLELKDNAAIAKCAGE